MKGQREAARIERLDRDHRCRACCGKLSFEDIGAIRRYCQRCRDEQEADVWTRHLEGESLKDISAAIHRSPSVVSEIVHRLERTADLKTGPTSIPVQDNLPRCRCGLRIDKDHLVCDLYGASQFANQRRGAGPTYPGNGWRGDE